MYEGHLPDGSGIQKHSAGSIHPVIIIHYGDGTARWVDQRRGTASPRSDWGGINTYVEVQQNAEAYMQVRDYTSWTNSYLLREHFEEFQQEFVR